MGEMAIDHGSELHLLRFLGRHREQLDKAILHKLREDTGTKIESIQWFDVPFDPENPQKDGEWKSMDFLDDLGGNDWKIYWPDKAPGQYNRRKVPSWDAIAKIEIGDSTEWLLVEAKAHQSEFSNSAAACGAGGKSLDTVTRALHETYIELGGVEERWKDVSTNWLGDHYQKANRLACLRFLNDIAKQPTRLLYIYFMGDRFRDSPVDQTVWDDAINAQYDALGIGRQACDRSHELFLNVIYPNIPSEIR